jgi:hypothetical protein
MSAGRFTNVNYQYSNGDIGVIRVQPDTLLLNIGGEVNAVVAGVRNAPRAFVAGSRRVQGRNYARVVRVSFDDSPPTGYAEFSTITLPLVNNAITAEARQPGAVGTYLGSVVRVVGVTPPAN